MFAVRKDKQGFRAINDPSDCTAEEDFFDVLPQPTSAEILAKCKTEQIAILEKSYQDAIKLPVAYMGTTFQADKASQELITGCLSGGALYAPPFWQDINNVQVPMTFTELQGLSGAIIVRGTEAFLHKQTLKANVNKTTTNTEAKVRAVVW